MQYSFKSSGEEADELYQMLSALRDSERKLEALLVNRQVEDGSSAGQETDGDVSIEVNLSETTNTLTANANNNYN